MPWERKQAARLTSACRRALGLIPDPVTAAPPELAFAFDALWALVLVLELVLELELVLVVALACAGVFVAEPEEPQAAMAAVRQTMSPAVRRRLTSTTVTS